MKHQVIEHKLACGAQGLVVNAPGSSVVNVVIRFNSGFQFTDRAHYEIPHVTEHLISCGSQAYPTPGDLKVEFQKNGAYRNAYTNSSINGYVVECAEFELDRILDLMEEYLVRPTFPVEAFATEVSNVREELSRVTTQHGSVCAMALAERAFPQENLNFDARIEQLAGFTHRQVLDHYEATHTSANARFYVAGSFTDGGAAVVRRLERLLEQLPKGRRRKLRGEMGVGQAAPVVTLRDIRQIYYNLDFYAPESSQELRYALVILRTILTGGYQSRVYGQARQRGLAYAVSSPTFAGPGETSFGYAGYVTAPNIKELFALAAREYRSICDGEVTTAELESAKQLIVGSSLRSHQTPGDVLGWYLDRYDREETIIDYDDYQAALKNVTAEQVIEVARQIVAPGARGFSLLGDLTAAQAEGYLEPLKAMWQL